MGCHLDIRQRKSRRIWSHMRYWRGRQKKREEGDGEGFVSQVRSKGGAVRVGVRGWRTGGGGGGVPCGWGGS